MSVHLENYPQKYENIDYDLIEKMTIIREICSNSLSIRKDSNVKVRIPLYKLEIYHQNLDFINSYKDVIASEINVKDIVVKNDLDSIGKKVLKIDFKLLGPKIGDKIRSVIQESKENKYTELKNGNISVGGVEIEKSDFSLDFKLKSSENGRFCEKSKCAVILDTKIDQELLEEGISRDFVRLVQQERKVQDLQINQRISLEYSCENQQICNSIEKYEKYICEQCLITNFNKNNNKDGKIMTVLDDEISIKIYV